MDDFAKLLSQLILTPSRNKKIAYLVNYFQTTSDPDRGYALAAITRDLSFKQVKSSFVKKAVLERVDPALFQLSYDYVGDLGETVALIWPDEKKGELPSVSQFFKFLEETPTKALPNLFAPTLSKVNETIVWLACVSILGWASSKFSPLIIILLLTVASSIPFSNFNFFPFKSISEIGLSK